ncbi:hypothetical protein [Streptomyces sp. NBC_00455]|uniref:hypothetical protein n=1 Tax=Streptomyces sp. NBC_00455 TaxID=2903654 RepID=UPI002E1FE092
MNKMISAVTTAAALACAVLAFSAPTASAVPARAQRCATIEVTGHAVPVTRGQGGPVVRRLAHGKHYTSCLIERGNTTLHACGSTFTDYYIVPAAGGRGGIIPLSCARVV